VALRIDLVKPSLIVGQCVFCTVVNYGQLEKQFLRTFSSLATLVNVYSQVFTSRSLLLLTDVAAA